jgi:hypothetical protein
MKLRIFYLKWISANILGWLVALSASRWMLSQGISPAYGILFVWFAILSVQFFMSLVIRSVWKFVIILGMNALGMVTIAPVVVPAFTEFNGLNERTAGLLLFLVFFGAVYGIFTGAPLAVLISHQNAQDAAANRLYRQVISKENAKRERAKKRDLRRSAVNISRLERTHLMGQFRKILAAAGLPAGPQDSFGEDVDPAVKIGPVELTSGDTYDNDLLTPVDEAAVETAVQSRASEKLENTAEDVVEEG